MQAPLLQYSRIQINVIDGKGGIYMKMSRVRRVHAS